MSIFCGSAKDLASDTVTLYYHGKGGADFMGRTFTAQVMMWEKDCKFNQSGEFGEVIKKGACFAPPMIMTEGAGICVSQTVAIASFLGDYLDLTIKEGAADIANARQINCDAADLVAEAFVKAGKDENWPARMGKWFAHFENALQKSSTKFFCNQATPTYADFHVLHPVEMMDIGTKGECFKNTPKLGEWFAAMKETKGYKAYLSNGVKIAGSANRFPEAEAKQEAK